jgi:hypothetical protein
MASGPTGKALRVPPITDPAYSASEADLIAVIKAGKGKMPSFAGKLTDGQIKDVMAYILHYRHNGSISVDEPYITPQQSESRHADTRPSTRFLAALR